jgi:hypothetical protein
LVSCRECQADVAASHVLCDEIASLPDPVMTREQAQAFDAAVLARLAATVPAPAPEPVVAASAIVDRPVPLRPSDGGRLAARASAAQTISLAARSKLSRRRFEPLFAPIPSLLLVSLGLALGAVASAVLFGELMVRALGGGFTVAAEAVWSRASWLAEGALGQALELATLVAVAQRVLSYTQPWLEACQELLATHGREVTLIAAVAAIVLTSAAWKLNRLHRARRRVTS